MWNWNNKGIEYNEARKRLTEYTFNHLPKGIGVNETTDSFSYYAPYGTTTTNPNKNWSWYQTVKDTETNTTTEYGRTWDSDYTLIGHACNPFVVRGGSCSYGTGAGVLSTHITYGYAVSYGGFRPALAF